MGSRTVYLQPVADGLLEVSTFQSPEGYEGEPVGYETLVGFKDGRFINSEGGTYSTREEAEAGHQEVASRWEAAALITCVTCLRSDQESVAVYLPGERAFCSDSEEHKLFCAVCGPEGICYDHASEEQTEI